MNYPQLTEGQRYPIALLYEDKFSLTEIGRRLGVNTSTISRELRRRASAKRHLCQKTLDFFEFWLGWKWSQEQISGVAQRMGLPVNHEWIYRHVYADKACGGELYTPLRQGKRRYRRGCGKKRSPIPDAVSIELRPAIVDERSGLGDWEADLVLGQQGTGAIVTLAERKSPIYLTKKVFSKDAHEVSQAIISLLSEYKDVCHTITFDNRGEFSQHKAIAKALEADMYFAHPYASYERGLNENTNGLLRQFIPKGRDLRTVSEEDLQRYQGALNSRPRKCLGFRQPSVVFAELRKAA